jgi:hypothetical protein
MKTKLFLSGILSIALVFVLTIASCGDSDGDTTPPPAKGDPLPASTGENALSGKTYFSQNEKIAFSITSGSAASGTYTKSEVKYDRDNDWQPDLQGGKYIYVDVETGTYSWNETAKTVTMKPEKVAMEQNNGGYGALQTRTEYRAAEQAMIDEYRRQNGDEAVNQELAAMGFSSVSAYLDYYVENAFKNVTNNYAFSSDEKALFLDEPLPANKGSNELSGQTYYGVSWDDNDNPVKNESKTYVFTADSCTYTQTWSGGGNYTETYTYAYNSSEKRVYLKVPTEGRDAYYNSSNTNAGNFESADDYNAAQVNNRYSQIDNYEYNTTEKTLEQRN